MGILSFLVVSVVSFIFGIGATLIFITKKVSNYNFIYAIATVPLQTILDYTKNGHTGLELTFDNRTISA